MLIVGGLILVIVIFVIEMIRTDVAASLIMLLVMVLILIMIEKIKSDNAIERIVMIVLRLLRSRFLKISVRYFVICSCSGYAEIGSEAVALVDAPPFSAPVNTPLSKW